MSKQTGCDCHDEFKALRDQLASAEREKAALLAALKLVVERITNGHVGPARAIAQSAIAQIEATPDTPGGRG